MTHQSLSLDGMWALLRAPLAEPVCSARRIARTVDGWIDQPVPGDIHEGLLAAGEISEPTLGMNSFSSEWTANHSWWWKRTFTLDDGWAKCERVELMLEGLDCHAEIFLNDIYLGSHRNTHRPAVFAIKEAMHAGGENTLLVKLTTGAEAISEAQAMSMNGRPATTEAQNGRPGRGDNRRSYLRRPQYAFGWDWCPKVPATAIGGSVTISGFDRGRMRDTHLTHRAVTPAEGDSVMVRAVVTFERFDPTTTTFGTLRAVLTDAGGNTFSAKQESILVSGVNFLDLDIAVTDARPWWPAQLGEPHLYLVEVSLETDEGDTFEAEPFEWGLRHFSIEATRAVFALRVNGQRVFLKGGNWIPCDVIYTRTRDEHYETLISEALACHFNMLRIWGGGLYERDVFYQTCDRLGILVWMDFMFACSPYPDHEAWFRDEVAREADYQTRRLRNHAALALWCGNNECHQALHEWWEKITMAGTGIYNQILPEAVRRNCPEIPYWPGSPYGGSEPNDAAVGDRHHWAAIQMHPDMERRITPENYDATPSRFLSEYGYVGPCQRETVETYLDGAPFDRKGDVWQHHNNVFEKDTVDAGIARHYTDPDALAADDYLFYAGVCQGMMYQYAFEAARFRGECHGNLFWMYNDCWGEVGWSIIDYYLRRKIAWWFTRRAYAPVRLLVRRTGSRVLVTVANDTREAVDLDLEFGVISLGRETPDLRAFSTTARANSRTVVMELDVADGAVANADQLWVVRCANRPEVDFAYLRERPFRAWNRAAAPAVSINLCEATGDMADGLDIDAENPETDAETDRQYIYELTLTSEAFAHAVAIGLPGKPASPGDNYFDLLPRISRTISITSSEPLQPNDLTIRAL